MDSHFVPVEGIFDDSEGKVFTKYRVSVKFTHLVFGGVPQNPEIIESWLRTRIMGGDQEAAIMLRRTLTDLGIEVPEDASREALIEAGKKMSIERNGNTFRRNGAGLALAAYNPKAMIKESTAILYPYLLHKWGATRKTPSKFVAETVFVDEYLIPLGRDEPDGTHMQVGHVDGPKGKRSTLTYYDYCIQPEITFTCSSKDDEVTQEQWQRILILGQRLGMSAMRSLSHGQFKVTAFDRV